MNKVLTIVFGILSIGSIMEALRVTTSQAKDVVANRGEAMLLSYSIAAIFIYLTIRFRRKSSKKPGL